jgi:hypothetical protein
MWTKISSLFAALVVAIALAPPAAAQGFVCGEAGTDNDGSSAFGNASDASGILSAAYGAGSMATGVGRSAYAAAEKK